MVDHPNLEEYRYPDLYDLENPDFDPEGPFYLSWAREVGGPVLELGCGTGRITIPFAEDGFEITGLDIVPGMLDTARSKAGNTPIQWIEADVRDFHLGRKFNFIFENGSVFMHMLSNEDQEAFLARVHEHLSPDGLFVVSLLFPHPEDLVSVTEEKEWFSYQDEEGREIRVSGTELYEELQQVKLETAIRRISNPDGTVTVCIAPLRLRYTFPQEMEGLLSRSGFVLKDRFGGPDFSPLTEHSRYMVFVCTLPGSHSIGELR